MASRRRHGWCQRLQAVVLATAGQYAGRRRHHDSCLDSTYRRTNCRSCRRRRGDDRDRSWTVPRRRRRRPARRRRRVPQTAAHRNTTPTRTHVSSSIKHDRHTTFLMLKVTVRYDTRCYFNERSKADTSQLNLLNGTDNYKVEKQKNEKIYTGWAKKRTVFQT